MRPPLNAGENGSSLGEGGVWRSASMRPPLNAGENIEIEAATLATTPALQ